MVQIVTAGPGHLAFIIQTILEAEKSGTNQIISCQLFNLSESAYRKFLSNTLLEDIPDWELGLSQYKVLLSGGVPCGALCGWVEKRNGTLSQIHRLNAYHILMPKPNMDFYLSGPSWFASQLEIPRKPNTIQTESIYIAPAHRGKGFAKILANAVITDLASANPEVVMAQGQLFAQNELSLSIHQKLGYTIADKRCIEVPEVLNFFPGNTKLLIEKTL